MRAPRTFQAVEADQGGAAHAGHRHQPLEDRPIELPPDWDLYPQTVLELATRDGTLRIDLREELHPIVVARLSRLGPRAAFAIVTSDNPYGRERPAAENEHDRRLLALELTEHGVSHLAADGVSPDGRHREQGFAVWTDLQMARSLARAHHQLAFFWFDGAAFRIEGALVAAPPRQLPVHQ